MIYTKEYLQLQTWKAKMARAERNKVELEPQANQLVKDHWEDIQERAFLGHNYYTVSYLSELSDALSCHYIPVNQDFVDGKKRILIDGQIFPLVKPGCFPAKRDGMVHSEGGIRVRINTRRREFPCPQKTGDKNPYTALAQEIEFFWGDEK